MAIISTAPLWVHVQEGAENGEAAVYSRALEASSGNLSDADDSVPKNPVMEEPENVRD